MRYCKRGYILWTLIFFKNTKIHQKGTTYFTCYNYNSEHRNMYPDVYKDDSHDFLLPVPEPEERASEDGRIGGEIVIVDISSQCGTMNIGLERMEVI